MMTTTKTESNFRTALTAVQAAWLRANGIEFTYSAQYRCNGYSKGGFFIEINLGDTGSVCVSRHPSSELDGEDCNDGEPVTVGRFPTLRAALANLAAR